MFDYAIRVLKEKIELHERYEMTKPIAELESAIKILKESEVNNG